MTKINTPDLEFYSKGKNAATLKVTAIPPTWESKDDVKYVSREGVFLFSLIPHDDDDKRKWDEAVSISLKANESFNLEFELRNNQQFKAYHDPDKGKDNEGKNAKALSIAIAKDQNDKPNGWFVSIKHKKSGSENVFLSKRLSFSEMAYIQDIMRSLRPSILGLAQALNNSTE